MLEDVAHHLGKAVQPANSRRPNDHGGGGSREHGARDPIALLDLEGTALVVAVDIGIDVADHDRIRGEQGVEGCVEGPWPQRRPASRRRIPSNRW